MRYSYPQITLQDIPGEITLALSISGCNIGCKGCHSTETWNPDFGEELNLEVIDKLLKRHKHISCVLFYGGEWKYEELLKYIQYVKSKGIKTALFSGNELEFFEEKMINSLSYIKVGAFIKALGGLNSKNTNQKCYKIYHNKLNDITYKFTGE